MNIQPIATNNISMGKHPDKANSKNYINRFKQKVIDALPKATFNDNEKNLKRWTNFTEKISRPAENRFIMGGTAIILQPIIDATNKKVDESTRTVSICRTIAKIIAGTTVGILVRGSCYNLVKNMTKPEGTNKFSKALLPKRYTKEIGKVEAFLKNYRSALSNIVAIGAMCFTNFLIDAPLTVLLTNKFSDVALQHKNDIAKSKEEDTHG